MLTRSGWGALLIAAVSFGTGRVFGILELYVLGAGVVAAVLFAIVSAMRQPPHLGIRRLLEPSIVRAGETARVDVQVANLGHQRTPVVQLWEPVGPTGGATMNLAPLRRSETTTAAYRLPTSHRGVIRVGPMQARRRDVLGLCCTAFELPGSVELLVIPKYTPTPFSLGGSSGRLGEHLRMRAYGQSGSEFHSLREYVMGDDLRRISWKASARSSEFIVKETSIEGVRRCTVVVDVDDDAYDAAGFERAMSFAAGLVTGAVAADLNTRVISPEVDLRGPDVAALTLRWLATANPEGGDHLPLPSLRSGEGMGVLVLVTAHPASRRVSEVRGGLSPDDTLVIVAVTSASGSATGTRFVVDATSDEAFRRDWAHLTGALSVRRSHADSPVAVGR